MKRLIAVLVAAAGLAVAGPAAYAQSPSSGSRAVVITAIPGGATFFTKGKDTNEPSFGSYGLGGALEVRVNRFVGVEGEIGGGLGVTQDLDLPSGTSHLKSPDQLNYSGNLVVSAVSGGTLTPYVSGGVGGLTLFDKPSLGIAGTETFFTSNVGGGLKWFDGRWGLRADYRFIAVKSKDDAPAFFGRETRYGHRIYGGVLINVGR